MKYWMIWICMAVLCVGAWADDGYRDFTNTEGKSFRGKVLSYDARKSVVKIEAENKKRAKVPLAALSEKDQAYVIAWASAQDFLSESFFRISLKSREEDGAGKARMSISERKVEEVTYEIKLENKSPTDLKGIKIEYCVFYEQEVVKGSSDECLQGICYGSMDVDAIAAHVDKSLSTKKVVIYKEEMNSDYYFTSGRDNVQDGEIHGIWLRASMALPSGERVYRECCIPDNLPKNRRWVTKSVNVGMNK